MTKQGEAPETSRRPPPPSARNTADPVRNFTVGAEERIRALTIGPPAWAVRKRRIEDEVAKLVARLVELHRKLVAQQEQQQQPPHDEAGIFARLAAAATGLDLRTLNDLVDRHNRYYPIEANLRMDLRGRYLVYGRPWLPEEPYTAERLLALAREELDAAG